jgi:hypothetical protein
MQDERVEEGRNARVSVISSKSTWGPVPTGELPAFAPPAQISCSEELDSPFMESSCLSDVASRLDVDSCPSPGGVPPIRNSTLMIFRTPDEICQLHAAVTINNRSWFPMSRSSFIVSYHHVEKEK